MKICAYRIIRGNTQQELEKKVNESAEQGFIPIGGLIQVKENYTVPFYVQPVARLAVRAISRVVRKALRKKK